MPGTARVLQFAVVMTIFCAGVQASRLSQLLKHFTRNHAELSQNDKKDDNPYRYNSPTGNGGMDLVTPYYGSYAHNYGPVNQMLTPNSGYGGYPGTLDPRGFNAPQANFTAGVLVKDMTPTVFGRQTAEKRQNDATRILGQNPVGVMPGIPPGTFQPPLFNLNGMPAGGNTPFGPMGVGMAGMLSPLAANGLGSPLTLAVAGGTNTGTFGAGNSNGGQVSGTIPVVFPRGRVAAGTVDSVAAASAARFRSRQAGAQQARAVFNAGFPAMNNPTPLVPLAPGALQGFGPIGAGGAALNPFQAQALGMRSPWNPSYSPAVMQHHQLTLGGSATGVNTPGFFAPMQTNYPQPDMDRYNSVISNPVREPDFGKGESSGSGAAA